MRILFVITRSELGGAQSVVAQLANTLSSDNEVAVVAGEGDGKLWEMLDRGVMRIRCETLQRALSPLKDLQTIVELRHIYRRYRPDIIHLHSSKAGTLGRIAFPRKRVIYTVHGFDSIRLAFRRFLGVERLLQHRTQAIVAVSNYDKQNLINEGIRRNVETIHNGLTQPKAEISSEHRKLFARYDKTVLTIARLSAPKLPKLFIETALTMPDYGFIWIGNIEGTDALGHLPANCHFLGNITGAGAYCELSDIFMLASEYEGLPMVIIEAMSHGCPVVASDVGGISEIVDNGKNGYVVRNRSDEFASKIRHILSSRARHKRFSLAARERYSSTLTVEHMTSRYLELYKTIID